MSKRGIPNAWRKRGVVRTGGSARDTEIDFEAEAERFRKLAPVLGYCGACGVSVDEANGKLHDKDCPYLPAERRRSA